MGSPGLKEYTVEIDGQVLRYRNATPVWTPFVWPNPNGVAASRITAITNEDKLVEIFYEPGRFSLDRLFEVAKKAKGADGVNELTWTKDGRSVTLLLRVTSAPGSSTAAGGGPGAAGAVPATSAGLRGARLPALVAGTDGALPLVPLATSAPAAVSPAVAATAAPAPASIDTKARQALAGTPR